MRIMLAGLALAGLATQDDQNSYKSKAPPELVGGADAWINAKQVLKLADLKGRVVWLEFSFLG